MKKKKGFMFLIIASALVILLLVLPICATRIQFQKRDESVYWVSNDPKMYFTWSDHVGYHGELTVDGETMQVAVCFDYGCGMDVWDAPSSDNLLFRGNYSFGWNKIYMSVVSDRANLFEGEHPTFIFVCKHINT